MTMGFPPTEVAAPENEPGYLDAGEEARLDQLLGAARGFHHAAIGVACVVLVLASLGEGQSIKLPLGDVSLPTVPAAIFGFLTATILSSASSLLLRAARPFQALDRRRVPFAWVLFAGLNINQWLATAWILAPVIVSALAAASLLKHFLLAENIFGYGPPTATSIVVVGLILHRYPDYLVDYLTYLKRRCDEDGQPLSLAVYLHYIVRVVSVTGMLGVLLMPILGLLPAFRELPQALGPILFGFAVGPRLLCLCATPFGKKVNEFGARRGFAPSYESSSMRQKRQWREQQEMKKRKKKESLDTQ